MTQLQALFFDPISKEEAKAQFESLVYREIVALCSDNTESVMIDRDDIDRYAPRCDGFGRAKTDKETLTSIRNQLKKIHDRLGEAMDSEYDTLLVETERIRQELEYIGL